MKSFADILAEYRVDFATEGNHHCRAGWVQVDCPFCGKDSKKYHLGYNLYGNYMNCWRCGHLPLLRTLALITGADYKVLKEQLGDLSPEEKQFKPTGRLEYPHGVGQLLPAHTKYLEKRGFDVEEITRLWKIQGIGHGYGGLQWRIFIPIHFRGVVVSWTTRSIVNAGVRYISAGPTCEAVDHHNMLYGIDYVRHAAIVVEGPTDVWRIGPGAVATLGTGFSPSQVSLLSTFPVRIICFDNERPAQSRARKLGDELMCFPGETYNVTLDGKDPGSANKRTIRKLRRMIS